MMQRKQTISPSKHLPIRFDLTYFCSCGQNSGLPAPHFCCRLPALWSVSRITDKDQNSCRRRPDSKDKRRRIHLWPGADALLSQPARGKTFSSSKFYDPPPLIILAFESPVISATNGLYHLSHVAVFPVSLSPGDGLCCDIWTFWPRGETPDKEPIISN